MDYTTYSNPHKAHQALLSMHHYDMMDQNNEANAAMLFKSTYNMDSATQLYKRIAVHTAVKTTIIANETSVNSVTARHPDDRQIKGVKSGLKHGRQKLPIKLFHKRYGHIGECGEECDVCKMVKGNMRRIYKNIDPYKETRPAHTWSMDTVTFSHRSLTGNKYATILRCKATGVIKIICCYLRSDIVTQLEQWIISMRKDTAYTGLSYKAVSVIVTDEPGEWSRRSQDWQAMLTRIGEIDIIYVTPETSKEAGHAESTNAIMEEITKAILMQQNLPQDHWEVAAQSAEWLLNRFPNLATDSKAPIDGDQAVPMELITGGRYSRRQIYRELSYYLMPGTPALVHQPKIRGSTLEPKVRWGIAWAMYREQVIFKCPFTASTFRSKSFTAFHLRDNMNYAQFLGLSAMPTTRKQAAIPGDETEKVTVHLHPAKKVKPAGNPPVVQLQNCDDNKTQNIYIEDLSQQTRQGGERPDNTNHTGTDSEDLSSELGGAVEVLRHQDQQLTPEPSVRQQLQQQVPTETCGQGQSGLVTGAQGEDLPAQGRVREEYIYINNKISANLPNQASATPGVAKHDDKPHTTAQGQQPKSNRMKAALPECHVSLAPMEWPAQHDAEWLNKAQHDVNEDAIAHIIAEDEAMLTGVNLSFTQLCKRYKIPHELHDSYYTWLLRQTQDNRMRYNQDQIPRGRGKYIKIGLKIPAPQGKMWRDLIQQRNSKQNIKPGEDHIEALSTITQAINQIEQDLQTTKTFTRQYQHRIDAMQVRRVKKKRTSAAGDSTAKQPPTSIAKAIRDEDVGEAYKWLESINKEWNGLTDMGVLDHGYTRQQLIAQGVRNNPIPFSVCLTYKFDMEGEIDRYKSRMALAGHRGNMQQGIHFDKTYSSTPVQHSSKILQALMVKLKLFRLAFDIKMAYCQADLPKDQLIAVRYPEGFRRYSETGEELFIILRKNLYGHPAAGRIWEKERNKQILHLFNTDGWTCKRCTKEPCLFIITKDNKRTWMLVWTDDCDMVGEDEGILQQIYERVNSKWESKLVDPAYMLGIRREVSHTDQGMEVELTMTAFVDAMTKAFQDHLKKRTVSTPLPDGFFIHKNKNTPETEVKAVLERGYQRLFGMLLWAARGTFPECLEGTSMLGRVMSAPTEEAWDAACHMLTYMQAHKHHGIRFTESGNSSPVAYVDSSNKPDPTDSKCQYGYAIQWQGGCVITCSKKLAHVGLSAAHNEYMAAHWCNRHTAWLRDLLTEMGLEDAIQGPTITYGDNKAANLLCEEDIITCGNQFMQVPYHYNKEATKMGIIKMMYVPTKLNLADLFTKSVSRQVLQELLPVLLGHRYPSWPSDDTAKTQESAQDLRTATVSAQTARVHLGEQLSSQGNSANKRINTNRTGRASDL